MSRVGRAGAVETLVLLNPAARSGEKDGAWRPALEALEGVEIRETRGRRDARAAIREAVEAGVGRIVAAGGDGTVNGTVNGLAAAGGLDRVALGVLPLGTANDYARSLGLPLEPEAAVEVLRTGRTRRVDLGRVDRDHLDPKRAAPEHADPERADPEHADRSASRYFANVSVGGFGGRLEGRVASDHKRRWGPLAYLRAAAEEITSPERYELRARLDGEEVSLEALHVIVANGSRAGGNIPVAPDARLDDGRLDVVLVPALELGEFLTLIPAFLAGGHADDERLVVRRVAEAAFESEPEMPFGSDGEPIGPGPAIFRAVPGALEVVC